MTRMILRTVLTLLALRFAGAATLQAQAPHTGVSLPAAAPTSQAPGAQPALLVQPAPARGGPNLARVQLRGGLLTVTADNSSLNQILREIADRSGMTITGGVVDERVFGTYGPADTGSILTQLLEGTGANILLLEGPDHRPLELVLTVRGGGPTPPAPPALSQRPFQRDQRDDDLPPQLVHNVERRPGSPGPVSLPAPALPVTTTVPAAAGTTPQSPNGVKTPQEIYEQLLKMQQPKPPQ